MDGGSFRKLQLVFPTEGFYPSGQRPNVRVVPTSEKIYPNCIGGLGKRPLAVYGPVGPTVSLHHGQYLTPHSDSARGRDDASGLHASLSAPPALQIFNISVPREQLTESLGSSAERPRALWLCPFPWCCKILLLIRGAQVRAGCPDSYWGTCHQPSDCPFSASPDGISCSVSLLACILPLGPWSFIVLSRFSRVRLCHPVDCSPPGSSVLGISQARILEWVAVSSSRGSSGPRVRTCISFVSCIGRWVLTTEPPGRVQKKLEMQDPASAQIHYPVSEPHAFPGKALTLAQLICWVGSSLLWDQTNYLWAMSSAFSGLHCRWEFLCKVLWSLIPDFNCLVIASSLVSSFFGAKWKWKH